MTSSSTLNGPEDVRPVGARPCPHWCATRHGVHLGEEDWVHSSAALSITDGVMARLCMSVDPVTHAEDGPYLLIGATQYTLTEAKALGDALSALAEPTTGSSA
jgi:hypothetical protein